MNRNPEDQLDQCFLRLQMGASLELCLADYPEDAAELKPLLLLSSRLGDAQAPAFSQQAFERGKARMLTHFAAVAAPKPSILTVVNTAVRRFNPFLHENEHFSSRVFLRVAAVILLAGVLVASLVVNASASSLPGDSLYGIKLAWQNVQLGLTTGKAHDNLLNQFQADHQREVLALMEHHKPVDVRFEGKVISVSDSLWQVGILSVIKDANTVIVGSPEVGDSVLVMAHIQTDHTLLGLRIEKLPLATPTEPTEIVTGTPKPDHDETRGPDGQIKVFPTGRPNGWPTDWWPRPFSSTDINTMPTIKEQTREARPTHEPQNKKTPTPQASVSQAVNPTVQVPSPKPTHSNNKPTPAIPDALKPTQAPKPTKNH